MESANILQLAETALDYGVMGILSIMSIVTLWLFIERMMFYKSVRTEDYEYRDNLDMDLTDNIGVLSAIGTNAPYVGLLGTVVGIMITFYTMGDVGAVDAKKIMVGLALALKATAMGLVVAMPAIVAYTITLRKVEKILTKFDVEVEAAEKHGKV
jgi:biopolymer transport protein ExbB